MSLGSLGVWNAAVSLSVLPVLVVCLRRLLDLLGSLWALGCANTGNHISFISAVAGPDILELLLGTFRSLGRTILLCFGGAASSMATNWRHQRAPVHSLCNVLKVLMP